jgi:tRNA-Thr(GGU) m(6)t(6)A37 methyltransferase TsaA
MEPIAFVHSDRKEPIDDNWNEIQSYIELTPEYTDDSLAGLQDFSHIEIIYYFHKVDKSKIICKSEHPRENVMWPRVGIFSQRKKARPNLIGATIAKIIKIEGKKIYLSSFDAIDGTPVLDIKPVFTEYLPKEVTQPKWVSELMDKYW